MIHNTLKNNYFETKSFIIHTNKKKENLESSITNLDSNTKSEDKNMPKDVFSPYLLKQKPSSAHNNKNFDFLAMKVIYIHVFYIDFILEI